MFDINTLAAKDSTEVQLRHPVTDELLFADAEKQKPIIAVLWGKSSKQHKKAKLAFQNRNLKKNSKKGISAEILEQEGIDLLVACSQRIENMMLDGEPIDCEAAFRKLYSNDAYSWLKEQVDEALEDNSNFLKA